MRGQRAERGGCQPGHAQGVQATERMMGVVMVRKSLSQVLVVGHCEEARGAQQQGG